jgi:hypothetical protein
MEKVMKTNLAYIDEVAREATAPGVMTKRAVMVSGFSVVTDAPPDSAVERTKRSYQVDADILRKKLKEIDVEPLAVLPKSWWKRIVEETGLYDLKPDELNQVTVYPQAFVEAKGWQFTNIWTLMSGVCAVALATSVAVSGGGVDSVRDALAFLGISAVGGFVSTLVLAAVCHSSNTVFRGVARLWAKYFVWRNGGDQKVMKAIVDSQKAEGWSFDVEVRLPSPPEDVAATLLKLRSIEEYRDPEIRVAAEPAAVTFGLAADELIARYELEGKAADRERRREKARLEAYERWLREDPIVYVEYGGAVAIVAQFGDFPIEKEVVDRVVGTFGAK